MSYMCYSELLSLCALYLRVKRPSGLHLWQQVGQRIKLLIKACLLFHQSLAEDGRKRRESQKVHFYMTKIRDERWMDPWMDQSRIDNETVTGVYATMFDWGSKRVSFFSSFQNCKWNMTEMPGTLTEVGRTESKNKWETKLMMWVMMTRNKLMTFEFYFPAWMKKNEC